MGKKKKESGKPLEIGGNVHITNGDFVGGDKNISVGTGAFYVGGNMERSSVVTGDNNQVLNASAVQEELFDKIFQRIEQLPTASPEDKEDLKANVEELKVEVKKGEQASESFLSRRLRNIGRIAPDIAEVVAASLLNPAAGFAAVIRKVAERAGGGASPV